MKAILFPLILSSFFTLISCVESNSQSSGEANSKQTTSNMKWSTIVAGNQCGVEAAKKVVVKTKEEFDDLWQECFQNMPEPTPKPTIDFTKEWVVAVFLGMANQGGHSIAINDMNTSGSTIKATLTHAQPGKNCMSTMSIEFPYVIARIEHFSPQKIDYDVTEKIVDCN